MKKRTAPVPEPQKAKSVGTRKPLLDTAVETVTKMFKPKSSAAKPAVKAAARKPAPKASEPKAAASRVTQTAAKPEAPKPLPRSRNPSPPPPKKNGAEEPKVEVDATTVVRRTYTPQKEPKSRPFCSKAMRPPRRPPAAPAKNFPSAPTPPAQSFSGGIELPEAYGTKKLFLTARDPHWLYAHWDLTREQQLKLNAALHRRPSGPAHLCRKRSKAIPTYEIHVHPESRHWFAHVERAGKFLRRRTGLLFRAGQMDARRHFQRHDDAARRRFRRERRRVRHDSV